MTKDKYNSANREIYWSLIAKYNNGSALTNSSLMSKIRSNNSVCLREKIINWNNILVHLASNQYNQSKIYCQFIKNPVSLFCTGIGRDFFLGLLVRTNWKGGREDFSNDSKMPNWGHLLS